MEEKNIIKSAEEENKVKFLVTGIKYEDEKDKLKEMGLYCYDLRVSDDGSEIASIENRVVVNRIGAMVTNKDLKINDYLDYNTFVAQNIQVDTIKELLEKDKNKNYKKER